MHRHLGTHPRSVLRQLVTHQVDSRDARGHLTARVVVEHDIERVDAQSKADCGGRRFEGDLDPADPVDPGRLLQVRDGGHDPVLELRRAVAGPLPSEVQGDHALLLPVRPRGERGMLTSYDELVVVAKGCVGQIDRIAHVEDRALGSDARARPPDVSGVIAVAAGKKQHPAANQEIGEGPAGGRPPDVTGSHLGTAARRGESLRQRAHVAPR